MSLIRPDTASIVRKQFRFKVNAYVGMFSTMVVLQLIAILFGGLSGVGSYMGGIYPVQYEGTTYSSDVLIGFTMLWAFISAILIKTKAYQDDDFIFVTNRLASNLSNIAFLFAASVIGGFTAFLSKFLLYDIIYLFGDSRLVVQEGFADGAAGLLTGFIAAVLYIFLFASLGYFVGTLVQMHKALAVIIPVVFFGSAFLLGTQLIPMAVSFYGNEHLLSVFFLKTSISICVLFAGSILIANQLEVRK